MSKRVHFNKEQLAEIVDIEPELREGLEECLLLLYKRARYVQENGNKGERALTAFDQYGRNIIRRLAHLSPHELDACVLRTKSYFATARKIHEKADKQARQIWRRAVRHGGKERRP